MGERAQLLITSRDKLIDAARERFGTVGYAATSMDELTAAAGLTRGALYHQFGGKEGLLAAVVETIDAEMSSRIEHRIAGISDSWERIRHGMPLFLEMALDPEIRRIVLLDAPAVLGNRVRPLHLKCQAAMAQVFRELMKEGRIILADPEALTQLVCGAAFQAASWIASAKEPVEASARAAHALDQMLANLQIGAA